MSTISALFRLLSLAIIFTLSWVSCDSRDENGLKKSEVHDIIHNPASAHTVHSGNYAKIDGGPFIYDAGKVREGAVIRHRFQFTNSGKNALEKIRVSSACGCTVAEFVSGKVPPGGLDSIEVIFDTKGFVGNQEKIITLIGNTNPRENYFTIKANVE